eukprot:14425580-Alexandrium_andersonii.AAC.1
MSLPQGCPWSPAALQITLALPTRRLRRQEAGALRQVVYLDDRTFGANQLDSFLAGHHHWAQFEFASGMRGNDAKRQVWACSPSNAAALAAAGWPPTERFGHVLGMVWGPVRRSAKDPKLSRERATRGVAA